MGNVVCVECGLGGDSKCPCCRSVFPNRDSQVAKWDAVLSHRLVLNDPTMFKFKLYAGETWREALEFIWDLAHDPLIGREDLKVFACPHSWAIAPGAKATIDCGHGAPNWVPCPSCGNGDLRTKCEVCHAIRFVIRKEDAA